MAQSESEANEAERTWWAGGDDEKRLQFELYKIAVQTRAQEIDRLWQRSNYLLILNSGMAAGLLALKRDPVTEALVAVAGFIVAVLWFFVNVGGKYWHTRWEQRTKTIEEAITPHAHMMASARSRNDQDVRDSLAKDNESRGDSEWGIWRWLRGKYQDLILTRNKPSVSESLTMVSVVFMAFWFVSFVLAVNKVNQESPGNSMEIIVITIGGMVLAVLGYQLYRLGVTHGRKGNELDSWSIQLAGGIPGWILMIAGAAIISTALWHVSTSPRREGPAPAKEKWKDNEKASNLDAPQKQDDSLQSSLSERLPFPDFAYRPKLKDYKGPLFKLSQDYPPAKVVAEKPDFLSIPFNENDKEQNWLKYLLAVRSYCFEGNEELDELDWDVRNNDVRKWYHAPWQHWGRNGREGIRGLTREADAEPGQLATTQTGKFQTYAIAFYNDVGAYTIGQVWRDHLEPDYRNIRFEVGTVVFKLLFTQAAGDQVPYLDPPVEWTAYAETSASNQTRSVQKLRLLQMDIMVRDDRVNQINGTGWVFGTYCYNGKVASQNAYEKLVPVGLQWGNDPDRTEDHVNQKPEETKRNLRLNETVINPSAELPPQHLGWNGRLNGPADYYASSCMSCHATAQYPVQRHQNPDFGTRKVQHGPGEWMNWFRNLKCGEPFSEYSNSTDFSLQLSIGIHNFHQWRDQQGGFSAGKPESPIEVKRGVD